MGQSFRAVADYGLDARKTTRPVMRALDYDSSTTYAAVLDALPIIAFIARPNGTLGFVSRGWERFTGNDSRTLLEHGLEGSVHPEDAAAFTEAWRAARTEGRAYRDAFRLRFGDGSYRWVVGQADPIRDAAGLVTNWFGTVTDIHDRRIAEAGMASALEALSGSARDAAARADALARSEERYRVLGEALPGVVWSAAPDGNVDYISEAPSRHPTDALASGVRLGEGWMQDVHPDERDAVRTRWQASVASGESYETQFRYHTADGSYRWQLARALPQREADGAIVRWVGVNVDIDDQRRADEGREQFVRLVEASDDFIAIADAAGNSTYINAAGRRMLAIGSADDGLGTPLLDYFLAADRAYVEDAILPTMRRQGRWVGEFRFRNFRTGAAVPIWYNGFTLSDETGRITGTAAVGRDLRERRRVEVGMRALAETGAAMYGSLDFDGTVRNVADSVVRSFATFCTVDALAADGTIRVVAARHRDRDVVALIERAAAARNENLEHPVARAIRRGESTLIATLPPDWMETTGMRAACGADLDRLDIRSLIFVPIRSAQNGRTFGSLTCVLDGRDQRERYTAEDLQFAEQIATRAGLALDHALAYERERKIAVTLQEASLPGGLPNVDHLHLSADYRPGSDEATIGGDWYDAFVLDDLRVVITIGDVLGHGLAAAVTMGKVRQAMQAVAMVLPDPNAMLDAADRTVRAQSADAYATAMAGILDARTQQFTFASAGHPGPIARDPDGRIDEFVSPGLLLGLRERGKRTTAVVPTPPGTTLVFFTDGLVEATRDIEEGHRRLHAAMGDEQIAHARNPARALVERILSGRAALDDVAVLVAQIGPSARFAERPPASDERVSEIPLKTATPPQAALPSVKPGESATVLTLPADFAEVAKARHAVRTLLTTTGAPETAVSLAELAAGELVSNAIDHGSGSVVEVSLRTAEGAAILAVTNDGPAFALRTADLPALVFEERGRGLALLVELGCTLAVARNETNRCTVTAAVPFDRQPAND